MRKVLAGEASSEEKTALQQYLASHDHLPDLADRLLPIEELELMPDGELPAGMEKRILQPVTGMAPVIAVSEKRPSLRRKLLRISAAAAILTAVSLVIYWFSATLPSPAHSAMLLDSLVVPSGTSKLITLADGSRIRLNGGTIFRYPPVFKEGDRVVYLDGEAFFEIAKDSSRPFIIHAPAFTTTVLGTSFNIKSSSVSRLPSEIAVATGKVRVAGTGRQMSDPVALLLPGQKLSCLPGDPAGFVTGQVPVAQIGSWKDHRFHYEQVSLAGILDDLERSYGLHFHAANPALLACTFSVTFRNMPPGEMLKTLSLMSAVQFHQKDSLIEVSGPACN